MALPFLPGFDFNHNIGRTDFLKAQRFTIENKLPVERDDSPRFPKTYCEAQKCAKFSDMKPAWQAYRNRVLCFDAFFEEPIFLVSQRETHRYRLCKIHYFLEDDTMEIIEPAQENSAIWQGIMVRRHQFKKPGFEDGESFYTFHDLNVDVTLEIYGRLYRTSNCDKYTRTFLTEMGITVKDPIGQPPVPYGKNFKEANKVCQERQRHTKKDTRGPYLKYHPLCLSFSCIWDDNSNLFGVSRKMTLYYFLFDDTIQIVEDRPENTGRTDTKVFWKTARLPKEPVHMPRIGEMTDTTILNLSGLKGNEKHYNVDHNPPQGRKVEYYTEKDFDIGTTFNVLGRKFLIYDCDEFTRKFYQQKYGKELKSIQLPEELTLVEKREIFPVQVFGTVEDSIQNCFQLRPKPENKDLLKFYIKDRYGFDSGQLKFSGSVIEDNDCSKPINFVVTYFLVDDTLSIFEPFEENSGRQHGNFMARKKICKPKYEQNPQMGPQYYGLEDLFVGNVLTVVGKEIILTGADEYTYKYMEKNPEQFIHSDFKRIMKKVSQKLGSKCDLLKAYFQSSYPKSAVWIPFDVFRKVMYESLPEKCPEQELITLARHYASTDDQSVQFEDVLAALNTDLLRKNYNDFDNLLLALKAFDISNTRTITRDRLYRCLRSCNVPIERDLLKMLLYKCPVTSGDDVNYADIVDALNYLKNPPKLSVPSPNLRNMTWTKTTKSKAVERINYINFIHDLKASCC